MIWNTEKEIYELLSTPAFASLFSELEANNNKIQYLFYKARLNPEKETSIKSFTYGDKIIFKEENSLPVVLINDKKFILDLGAMNSTVRPQFLFDQFSLEKMEIMKMLTLKNVLGEQIEAPVISLTAPLVLGGVKTVSSNWVLANLKIPNIEGVLGLDALLDEFILYPKKGILSFEKIKWDKRTTFNLQRDYNNTIKSLEFICPNKRIFRVDSGSQVFGDVINDFGKIECGKLSMKGKFERELKKSSAAFEHDVSGNLGWPWLRNFKAIKVSLKDGLISFEK